MNLHWFLDLHSHLKCDKLSYTSFGRLLIWKLRIHWKTDIKIVDNGWLISFKTVSRFIYREKLKNQDKIISCFNIFNEIYNIFYQHILLLNIRKVNLDPWFISISVKFSGMFPFLWIIEEYFENMWFIWINIFWFLFLCPKRYKSRNVIG